MKKIQIKRALLAAAMLASVGMAYGNSVSNNVVSCTANIIEARFDSEVSPLIGLLRTRIALYEYEKGKLPCLWGGLVKKPHIETWKLVDKDKYIQGYAEVSKDKPYISVKEYKRSEQEDDRGNHFGSLLNISCSDILGKWVKPNNFQYLVLSNNGYCKNRAYFIGCFGDGNALPMGTGYAVCEIVAYGKAKYKGKYIGVWKRYTAIDDLRKGGSQIGFTSCTLSPKGARSGETIGCYVPTKEAIDRFSKTNGEYDVITEMKKFGWEF